MCVIPALRCLRETYPGSRVTLVASPVNHDIMLNHPFLDRVLLYDKRLFARSPGALRDFIRELTGRRYDLAVVPSTVSVSLTSGILARISGAPVRVGPGRLDGVSNPSAFLYTHAVELDWSATPGRHQAMRNIDMLRPLGIQGENIEYVLGLTQPETSLAGKEIAEFRSRHTILIGMHPGAAKPGNIWPAESFAAVARRLHEHYGNGLVVTVGPRDGTVHSRLREILDVPHIFVKDRPLRDVAALINETDLFLSNDTGILHIAGALRPETLGLFGPTNPLHWAPAGRSNHYVSSKDGLIGSITDDEVFRACDVILRKVMARNPK